MDNIIFYFEICWSLTYLGFIAVYHIESQVLYLIYICMYTPQNIKIIQVTMVGRYFKGGTEKSPE